MLTRRFRTLAGLVALFAFSAFFAESVWASMCPPESGMEMAAGVEGALHSLEHDASFEYSGKADEGAHGEAADCGSPFAGGQEESESSHSSSHDLPCPLAFAGAGSCTSVMVPATTFLGSPFAGLSDVQPLSLDALNGLLPITSLYRPPRA